MRSARRIFNLGIRWGYVTANPFAHMELSEAPARETVIPRDHVDLFCATAIAIDRRSLALWARLSYELCQRSGDARTLPWSRYNGQEVKVKQGKTSALVWAPLLPDLPELKAMLDETPRVSTIIVIDEKPSDPTRSITSPKPLTRSGMPLDCRQSTRRGTCAGPGMDETGDAGATDDELRSLSGHKDRNVVHVYVKPNRQKAANALAKRRAHRSETKDSEVSERRPEATRHAERSVFASSTTWRVRRIESRPNPRHRTFRRNASPRAGFEPKDRVTIPEEMPSR
jgi:hypothetical protein